MLTAEELRQRDKQKSLLKKDTYKQILNRFSSKIKASAEANKKVVYLTIPTFVVGCPAFNLDHARAYIIRQLVNAGYNVCKISRLQLAVTWVKENHRKRVHLPSLPSFQHLSSVVDRYR